MNKKRDLVAKALIKTLTNPKNVVNLRSSFESISKSKAFRNDNSITPNYVRNVWYNYVAKNTNGDTRNKIGNQLYCFATIGYQPNMVLANRKVCKKGKRCLLYPDDRQPINED